MGKVRETLVIVIATIISLNYLTENPQLGEVKVDPCHPDLKFVKKITQPNFWAKEFYMLKPHRLRLFSLAINTKMHHNQ